MEKVSLAKKAVYALRSMTMTFNHRLRSTAKEFRALTDDFSKLEADPNLKHILSKSPKEDIHVREVTQRYKKSVAPLIERYKHFKEHEEPNLEECDMFRDIVTPSVAATVVVTLLGEIAYKRHLEKKDQGS
ncbi:hypothetical protein MKW94_024285 [Papaver nudicaule]|uniref:Uncharacterized protein n=1 Tax=Papaver nudicaule TaxID=74823 RepID=A0AA41SEX6_PAPNU|nr:hypothetical protein [Papaver nudicaule]